MPSVANVGKVFSTAAEFLAYLETIRFTGWRPSFVTAHHTGSPTLKNWNDWQTRKLPVTDEQWLQNLARYYGVDLGWSSAPHFFFTPKHYCVLFPPDRRGTHAKSFNGLSWGVEMVGNFDVETMPGDLRRRYVAGLACLHIATGLKVLPYKYATQGLHFHRDDPLTSKTCAGKKIDRPAFAKAVQDQIMQMTGIEAPAEKITPKTTKQKTGTVFELAAGDVLNVRADASGKSPTVASLRNGETVTILGEAMNGPTKWLRIDLPGDADGYVSARYISTGK